MIDFTTHVEGTLIREDDSVRPRIFCTILLIDGLTKRQSWLFIMIVRLMHLMSLVKPVSILLKSFRDCPVWDTNFICYHSLRCSRIIRAGVRNLVLFLLQHTRGAISRAWTRKNGTCAKELVSPSSDCSSIRCFIFPQSLAYVLFPIKLCSMQQACYFAQCFPFFHD